MGFISAGRLALILVLGALIVSESAEAAPQRARKEIVVIDPGTDSPLALTSKKVRVKKKRVRVERLSGEEHSDGETVELSTEWEARFEKQCAKHRKQGKFCHPNIEFRINATPNDSSYSTLHGMGQIAAPSAWEINSGDGSVVAAVIDTGVDYSHPDLIQNIWVNPGEVPGDGIDNDSNGYIDDLHGYDFANDDGNPMDDNSHGTHVAGTVGARGNNNLGVVGVNWNVKIMAIKFLNANGAGFLSDAIAALDYALEQRQNGVNLKVVNNSWGVSGSCNSALKAAIQALINNGIVVVSAAGNSASSGPHCPSSDSSLSVAAVDKDGNLASFSNYNPTTVDLAAPGVSILSTTPGGEYKSFSGTSMAAPHVAGAVALTAAQHPSFTSSQLVSSLMNNVTTWSTLSGVVLSSGILNVAKSLTFGVEPGELPSTFGIRSAPSAIRSERRANYVLENENHGDTPVTLSLGIKLDEYECGSVGSIEVPAGVELATISLRPPKSIKGVGTLELQVDEGGVGSSVSLAVRNQRTELRSNSVSASKYSRLCSRLGRSLELKKLQFR